MSYQISPSTAESTNLPDALVSGVQSTAFVGLYRNSEEEVCRYFDDLVNNDYHYHNNVVTASEESIKPDNSNYQNIPSILDDIEDIVANPQKYAESGPRTYRVPSDACFTMDAKLGNALGQDRLWKFHPGSSHVKRYDEYIKKQNGWNQSGSASLIGVARWVVDPFGKVIGIVISKLCGNGRHYMKLRCNGGKVSDLMMTLEFHPVYTDMDYKQFQKVESEIFAKDQQDQNPHDQSTKFIAGVKSGDKSWVQLRDLFEKHDVDFDGIVSKTSKSTPNWNLGSFEGFSYGKAGKPGREIRQFGEENFQWALDTIKEIQWKRAEMNATEFNGKGLSKLPHNEIPNSALRVIMRAFHMLTEKFTDEETGRQIQAFCEKEELKSIIVHRYSGHTDRSKEVCSHALAELNQKDDFKDMYFIGIASLVVDVLNDYKIASRRTNRVKSQHPVMRRYIDQCSNVYVRENAVRIIDNRP